MYKIDYSRSCGSYAYVDGKSKLDMFNHYGSNALGYHHDIFDESFYDQVEEIVHLKTSTGKYKTDIQVQFENAFRGLVDDDQYTLIHYCSTGSLAIQAALKVAYDSLYSYWTVDGLKGSFHGLYTDCTDKAYYPHLFSGTHLSIARDIDTILHNNTSQVLIIEPIRCSAGDLLYNKQKLIDLVNVWQGMGRIVISDEVQTGLSTGDVWYLSEVSPDIRVFGKKFQVSGVMVRDGQPKPKGLDHIMTSKLTDIDKSKLSCTFDGDLIDMLRATYVIRAIERDDLLARSEKLADIFCEEIGDRCQAIGSLIRLEFKDKAERDKFLDKTQDDMLVNPTMDKYVRLRPNLAITDLEIEHAIKVINGTNLF